MKIQKINSNKDIIDKIFFTTKSDSFSLSEKIKFNYLALVQDSEFDLEIQTEWEEIEWNIFLICFGKWNVTSKIQANISNSETRINVFILSLLQDDNSVNVDWDIKVNKNVSNSQWHLMEKNIILWKKVKVKMAPKLDVYSQNVQATHWVSIDKIDPEKKFYIQSRGLSNKEAMELSIHGYIQYILEFFDITDLEKNEIENTILSNIQIDD